MTRSTLRAILPTRWERPHGQTRTPRPGKMEARSRAFAHPTCSSAAQPRTSQMSATPSTAEKMPAMRSDASGLSTALAARRFAAPGKAAKRSPSIARTRPIATRNSGICPLPQPGLQESRYLAGGFVAGAPPGAVAAPAPGELSRDLPVASPKYLKKSESGLSSIRVSFGRRPFS
jgi:hypothetical protein